RPTSSLMARCRVGGPRSSLVCCSSCSSCCSASYLRPPLRQRNRPRKHSMIEAGSLIRSLSGRPAARNFHTFVINEIGLGIVTGRFPIGSILANDAEMMETYGVSRTVLREALKTLEAKGMVEARPKVGTRVTPSSRWSFFDPQVLSWHFYAKPDQRFFESLFDVRGALEARAIALASARRTAEHVRLMKYWRHQMDIAQGNLEAHGLSALEIHRVIADSSGNALLRSVTGIVELTLA